MCPLRSQKTVLLRWRKTAQLIYDNIWGREELMKVMMIEQKDLKNKEMLTGKEKQC